MLLDTGVKESGEAIQLKRSSSEQCVYPGVPERSRAQAAAEVKTGGWEEFRVAMEKDFWSS